MATREGAGAERVGFRGTPCPSRLGEQRKLGDTGNRSIITVSLEEFHRWSPWSCFLPWRIELESNNLETPPGITEFLAFTWHWSGRLSVSPGFPLVVIILKAETPEWIILSYWKPLNTCERGRHLLNEQDNSG